MNAASCSFTIVSITFSYSGSMLIGLWSSGFLDFGIFGIGITKVFFHASGNSPRNSDLLTMSSKSTATTSKASTITRFVTFSTPAQSFSDRTVSLSLLSVIG
uniref:(northern house mosquito) hypothetical protein n=1 Tax=Culex pipiens TaxID=7175 RepID=A0A8D8APK4_CULPI